MSDTIVQPGSADDPVDFVWMRTRSGKTVQLKVDTPDDVDRVITLLTPKLPEEEFRFAEAGMWMLKTLSLFWLFELLWDLVGLIVIGALDGMVWVYLKFNNGLHAAPAAFVKSMHRLSVRLQFLLWRRTPLNRIKRAAKLREARSMIQRKRTASMQWRDGDAPPEEIS